MTEVSSVEDTSQDILFMTLSVFPKPRFGIICTPCPNFATRVLWPLGPFVLVRVLALYDDGGVIGFHDVLIRNERAGETNPDFLIMVPSRS
jgi:hypothetical protein